MSAIAVTLECTVVSHAKKEYITAGDWVKEYLPAHAVLFFIVPETSGASIKVLEDNEGS